MSIVADQLRQFWLSRLNEVTGTPEFGLAEWVKCGTYQITTPLQSGEFVLDVPYGDIAFQRAIAFDLARMSMAAFESIGGIQEHPILPKSLGWTIITTYYSAFFAAHALLRAFGTSLTQFDASQIRNVSDIATVYGSTSGQTLNKGFYVCMFNAQTGKLTCKHAGSKGGSHEILWKYFLRAMVEISNQILASSGSLPAQQQAAAKLIELCNALKYNGANAGSWLSNIRNLINYKHELGVWFPYTSRPKYFNELPKIRDDWRKKPEDISIKNGNGRDLLRFVGVSHLILALLKVTVDDMAQRCPLGRSFHRNTTQKILNFLE